MDLGILQYQWRGTPPSPLESIAVNLQLWDGAEEVVDIAASTEIVLNSSLEQGSVELDACPTLLTDVLRRGAARRILTRAARDHARSTAEASLSSSSIATSHLTDDEADEAEDAGSPAIRLLPPLSDDVDLWQLRVCIRGWADERSLIDVNIPLSTAASIPIFVLLGGELSLRLSPSPAEKAAAAATAARAAAAAAVAAASVVSVTSSGTKGTNLSAAQSPRKPPQSPPPPSSSSSSLSTPSPPPGSPPPARPASIDGNSPGEEENGDSWGEGSSTVSSPASSVDSSSSSSPSNVKQKRATNSPTPPPPASVAAESKGERSRRKSPSPTPQKFPAPTGAIDRSKSRSEQEEAEEEEARRQLPTFKLQLDALKKQIADQEARGKGASDALARAEREMKLRALTDARRVTAEAQVKSLKEELQTLETAKMASDRAAVENADVALAWKERSEGWESAYENVKEEYDNLVATNAAAERDRELSQGLRAITTTSSSSSSQQHPHRDSISSPSPNRDSPSPTALAVSSQSPSSSSSLYQLHPHSSGVARTPPDSGRASPSSSLHTHSPSGTLGGGSSSSHSASKDVSIAAVAAVQAELRETKERHAARLIALETQIALLKEEAESARSQAAREAAKSKTVRQAFTAAQACLANYVQVLEKACQETAVAIGSTRPWTNTIPTSVALSPNSSNSSSSLSSSSSSSHASLGALVISAANAAVNAISTPNAPTSPSSSSSPTSSSSVLDASSSNPLRHLCIRTPFIFSGYEVRALLNGPPISNSSSTVSIASSVSGNTNANSASSGGSGGQGGGQSSGVADGFLQNDTNVASTGHIALAQSSQNAFTALLRALEDLYKSHAEMAIERNRAMSELQQTVEARAEARAEAKAAETRRQLEAQVEERSKLVRDWEFFAQHWETRGRDAEKLNAEWERSFESANRQTGAAAIEAEGLRRMEIRLRFEVESAHAEAKQLRELLVALGHGSALASVVRRLSVPGLGNDAGGGGGSGSLLQPPTINSVLSSSSSIGGGGIALHSSGGGGGGGSDLINNNNLLGPTGLLTGVNAVNPASSNGMERSGGGGTDAAARHRIPSLPPPPSLHAAHLGLIQQQQQQMQLQQQQREAAKTPAVSVQAATLKKRSTSIATTYPETEAPSSLSNGGVSVAGTLSSPAGAAAVAKLSAATTGAAAAQAYLTRK
jgi:trimeric autotransporter adhesin